MCKVLVKGHKLSSTTEVTVLDDKLVFKEKYYSRERYYKIIIIIKYYSRERYFKIIIKNVGNCMQSN